MAKSKLVWTAGDGYGKVYCIFRTFEKAQSLRNIYEDLNLPCVLTQIPRREAVASIRKTIWIRSKGHCEKCGEIVTEQTGHMHEVIHRGRGGEIALDKSRFICQKCHDAEHSNRKPKFTKGIK